MSKNYDNTSISTKKDEKQVRERVSIMLNSDDRRGAMNGIFEVIANSADELLAGYGDAIYIKVREDDSLVVEDKGRGVPMDWNEKEQEYNWKLVYATQYASGKYDDGSYENSLGLNGVGATVIQYASEFFRVESRRDGKKYTMNFEKGVPIGELTIEPYDGDDTGTIVDFKPDGPDSESVFSDITITLEEYLDKLRRSAMLMPGIKFIIEYKGKPPITLCYDKGPSEFFDQIIEKKINKEYIDLSGKIVGRESQHSEEYMMKVDVTLGFSREASLIETYHNGGTMLHESTSNVGLSQGLLEVFNGYARENGKLARNERFIFSDISEILICALSTKCAGRLSKLEGQVKSRLYNELATTAVKQVVVEGMAKWVLDHKAEMDRVLADVLLNKEAREKSESIKKSIIKEYSKNTDTLFNRPDKFLECAHGFTTEQREIYVVEGDSAMGACRTARLRNQAILALRGKILNCIKAKSTAIIMNNIISGMMRVLGCGVEFSDRLAEELTKGDIDELPKFDLSKLRYDKIIICTDADLDGKHIRCLVLTALYVLAPTLIKEGKVYIVETPLYEIKHKKESYFAYSDLEKDLLVSELIDQGISESRLKIKRSKGLGENSKEMMNRSTMSPDTRRLTKVEYKEEDMESVRRTFNMLLGDDLVGRKHIIEQYFDIEADID